MQHKLPVSGAYGTPVYYADLLKRSVRNREFLDAAALGIVQLIAADSLLTSDEKIGRIKNLTAGMELMDGRPAGPTPVPVADVVDGPCTDSDCPNASWPHLASTDLAEPAPEPEREGPWFEVGDRVTGLGWEKSAYAKAGLNVVGKVVETKAITGSAPARQQFRAEGADWCGSGSVWNHSDGFRLAPEPDDDPTGLAYSRADEADDPTPVSGGRIEPHTGAVTDEGLIDETEEPERHEVGGGEVGPTGLGDCSAWCVCGVTTGGWDTVAQAQEQIDLHIEVATSPTGLTKAADESRGVLAGTTPVVVYFSFGYGQKDPDTFKSLLDHYVTVVAPTFEQCREAMFASRFGNRWSFDYLAGTARATEAVREWTEHEVIVAPGVDQADADRALAAAMRVLDGGGLVDETEVPCYVANGFQAPEVIRERRADCLRRHPGRPCDLVHHDNADGESACGLAATTPHRGSAVWAEVTCGSCSAEMPF